MFICNPFITNRLQSITFLKLVLRIFTVIILSMKHQVIHTKKWTVNNKNLEQITLIERNKFNNKNKSKRWKTSWTSEDHNETNEQYYLRMCELESNGSIDIMLNITKQELLEKLIRINDKFININNEKKELADKYNDLVIQKDDIINKYQHGIKYIGRIET